MALSTDEKMWIRMSIEHKDKYKIFVDNDEIFVVDIEENECIFTFDSYGDDFIVNLLDQLKCNVGYV